MAYCKLQYVWPDPTAGTGPFVTGFDYEVPGGTGDQEDVVGALSALWASGMATFKGYFSSELGAGYIRSIGDFSGSIVEYFSGALAAPTGSPADLPGCSLRGLKVASRPAGGRRGSMFWPLLEASAYDGAGTISGTPRTDLIAGLELIRTTVEAAVVGAVMVQKHVVGGTTTYSQVTEMSIAPTVTYMNRRYR
jgi:hypothetical protein